MYNKIMYNLITAVILKTLNSFAMSLHSILLSTILKTYEHKYKISIIQLSLANL